MQVDFPSKHSSNRYTSPRKLNLNNDELFNENRRIPIQRISINSRDSSVIHPTYKFGQSTDNSRINQNSSTYDKQTIIKKHHQRSSPTTGLQSSYDFEHHRSNSPALSNITEEDSHRSITPHTDSSNESPIFPQNFNSDIFYKSIFQPEIFTDDRNQRYIEMKLDVYDYNPDDIKVSINDNDLIVQIKNSNFYKQITLPSNIDLTSLSVHHHYDKKLYITIKLLDEHSSFKYI
jgi:HSP20 family molecular chaperone IbpA